MNFQDIKPQEIESLEDLELLVGGKDVVELEIDLFGRSSNEINKVLFCDDVRNKMIFIMPHPSDPDTIRRYIAKKEEIKPLYGKILLKEDNFNITNYSPGDFLYGHLAKKLRKVGTMQ